MKFFSSSEVSSNCQLIQAGFFPKEEVKQAVGRIFLLCISRSVIKVYPIVTKSGVGAACCSKASEEAGGGEGGFMSEGQLLP